MFVRGDLRSSNAKVWLAVIATSTAAMSRLGTLGQENGRLVREVGEFTRTK